jgi:hypothetical protein
MNRLIWNLLWDARAYAHASKQPARRDCQWSFRTDPNTTVAPGAAIFGGTQRFDAAMSSCLSNEARDYLNGIAEIYGSKRKEPKR